MKYKASMIALLTAAMTQASAEAGIVFEVKTTYASETTAPEIAYMSVEGSNLKMDILSGNGRSAGTPLDAAIYRGDYRQIVIVSHKDHSYQLIEASPDRQGVGGSESAPLRPSGRIADYLDDLTPKQREMMKQAMNARKDLAGADTSLAGRKVREFRATSERATRQGYPCRKYDVLLDGEKIQEIWVTDWDNIEDGADVIIVLEEMDRFWKETIGRLSKSSAGQTPLDAFVSLDGFPVVTRDFEGGELESETVLRSAVRRDINPDEFEPPKGYRLRSMGPE